jgi:Flp pilus assembly protein TadG
MILRRLQKGQSVIEFALVLPLFLLFVVGVCYVGMIMADYLTLSSIARSSAREASVKVTKEEYKQKGYKIVYKNYEDKKLPVDIFSWNPKDHKNDFKITYENNSQNVKVEMKAALNKKGYGYTLAKVVDGLAGSDMKNMKLSVTYTMYSENKLQ